MINGLTGEAVGALLFELGTEPHIDYPSAQNSHRYEDAHKELYRSIHDAISKACIEKLAQRRGRALKVGSDRTLDALKKLLPVLTHDAAFTAPLDNVSEQRRRASHKHRPPAVPFRAFETFTEDLRACSGALTILRRTLEQELGMDAEQSTKRQDALKWLPEIATPPESNYSINGAADMAGKSVERVELGSRAPIPVYTKAK